jgi:hypothetical protein
VSKREAPSASCPSQMAKAQKAGNMALKIQACSYHAALLVT